MNPQKTPSNAQANTHLIVVMGVSGSGKSTIADAVAKHYSFFYLDGDDFHSEAAREQMASGVPLTDALRAPWVEAICLHLQERASKRQHCVLAFSGLKKKHRDQLRGAGLRTLFLFLAGDKDLIQQRLQHRKGHFMAPQLLDSQFDSLEYPGDEDDVISIDISGTLAQVTQGAITALAPYLPPA